MWKGIGIAFAISAVLVGTFFYLYGYGLPVKAENLTLSASLQCTTDRDPETGERIPNGGQEWVVNIGTTSGYVITSSKWVCNEEGKYDEVRIHVRYSPIVFPWDYTGPILHGMFNSNNKDMDDITVTVVCADSEISYSMKEEGLWDLTQEHSAEFCPFCTK